MAETVSDVCDERIRVSGWISKESVDGADDHFDEINIFPFVESSDIVGFSNFAIVENCVDSPGVVLDVEPVSYIFTFSVDGKRFALTYVVYEKRYELFRELLRTVIIRAVCDDSRHSVGIMVRSY